MQTVYRLNPDAALEGALADTSSKQSESGILEDASGLGVNPGVLLVLGSGDNKVKVPATSADVTAKAIGVLLLEPSREQGRNVEVGFQGLVSGPSAFRARESVSVLRRGRVHVKAEEAVSKGDPVFVRFATGAGGTRLGAFRKSADSGSAEQLPGAIFFSSAPADGLAIVEINLP